MNMNEEEKMKAGKIYDPNDDVLVVKREKAHILCRHYNSTDEHMVQERRRILSLLLPGMAESAVLMGPIFFDYGTNTTIGRNSFANFNFTVLDCAPVTIGDDVYIGPNVSLYTPVHPLLAEERRCYRREDGILTDKEYAKPIVIEKDCWIAGGVTILGGVRIGEGSVIGAGSVVTKDIPPNSLAYGNPCRVVRTIDENDSIYRKKELFE